MQGLHSSRFRNSCPDARVRIGAAWGVVNKRSTPQLRASSSRVDVPGLKPHPWLGTPPQQGVRERHKAHGITQSTKQNTCACIPW